MSNVHVDHSSHKISKSFAAEAGTAVCASFLSEITENKLFRLFCLTCVDSDMSHQLTGFLKRLPTVLTAICESASINVLLVIP